MRVGEAELLKPLNRPIRRLLKSGRTGQPWSGHLAQIKQVIHHLRTVESLFLDPMDRVRIDRFPAASGPEQEEHGKRQEKLQALAQHAVMVHWPDHLVNA